MKTQKCNKCEKDYQIYKFTYYSQALKTIHTGKTCDFCRKNWGNKMQIKKEIKRLMSEKYPDIINEIYEEND